ncbi:MAG: zf-HC2 domain-containing protein [Clostridium sp.]|nr:zf-HC2 domain-containing protein [Clostridium sp.]
MTHIMTRDSVEKLSCAEEERLVEPYIRDQLRGVKLSAFLKHLDSCESCREELEIYYMIDTGLKQLDRSGDLGPMDIAGSLKQKVAASHAKMHFLRNLYIGSVAVYTLTVMAIVMTMLLQIRVWIFK